jgi:hypothetical protein
MAKKGKNEVKEFTGMWRLKPEADLVECTKPLAPGGWVSVQDIVPSISVNVQGRRK